ncbi:MAG: hypothetical protein SPJ05_07255, partial [Candidatus Limisoma sp.]|nr:hypothetical protein [Candidatus Limisoma sp.]
MYYVENKQSNHLGLIPANGFSPNFSTAQKFLADSNNINCLFIYPLVIKVDKALLHIQAHHFFERNEVVAFLFQRLNQI